MELSLPANVRDVPDLRDRVGVFADRSQAGDQLARMLSQDMAGELPADNSIVLAVPSGGIPVACRVAVGLGLGLDVAVVSKITPGWNTEVGYGAVAFDGSHILNDVMVRQLQIDEEEMQQGLARTRQKVQRRLAMLRKDHGPLQAQGMQVVLVDDGLASGYTVLAAVGALEKAGARRIILAVPTGHLTSVQQLARRVDRVFCPNIRWGYTFAVAEAYRNWTDVEETQAFDLLEEARRGLIGRP